MNRAQESYPSFGKQWINVFIAFEYFSVLPLAFAFTFTSFSLAMLQLVFHLVFAQFLLFFPFIKRHFLNFFFLLFILRYNDFPVRAEYMQCSSVLRFIGRVRRATTYSSPLVISGRHVIPSSRPPASQLPVQSGCRPNQN